MTGIIYLRTDRFEVKLEGITFKVKDFESLRTLDFLFPDEKIRSRPQVVGIDIIRHPRDHNVILLLLCIGVGCMILRLHEGEFLPKPILNFLKDERTRFVGFALLKKSGLFPYDQLGLKREKVDIRYLAATRLNDSTYKRSELKELSRKVLGIKRMTGVTDASSFERHEHIKHAICQLFITTAIGMKLLSKKYNHKSDNRSKIMSFLKSLNSLSLFRGRFLKLFKVKKEKNKPSLKIENSKKNEGKESMVVDDNFNSSKLINCVKDDVSPKETVGAPKRHIKSLSRGHSFYNGNVGWAKVKRFVKYGFSLGAIWRENYSSGISQKYICEKPQRPLEGLSSGDDDIGSPKEIGGKDGISLSPKGREHNPIDDDYSKHTLETLKRPLEDLLSHGDDGNNFGWAKLKKIVKDGSAKWRGKKIDDSNKDTFETPKGPLEDLPINGDSFYDDNFVWARLKNLVKESVALSTKGRENNSSDDSNKNTCEKRPLKGILKRSTSTSRPDILAEEEPSPPSSFKEATTPPQNQLRRANSKGLNVSFAFKLGHQ